jgi:PhoPQ-activated pathogenicity-related protein
VGEKYLIYVPNNGHGLPDRARLVAGLNALNRSVMTGKPLPKLQWSFKNGGDSVELNVESDVRPSRVQVWASKSATRDFRDAKWTATDAKGVDAGFVHKQATPAEGYSAFLGEAVFHEGTDNQFWLSTNVRIVPSNTATGGK